MLGLDLTIGLIYVIANWIQKIRCVLWSSLHRCYRKICSKSAANWKELSSSILDIF